MSADTLLILLSLFVLALLMAVDIAKFIRALIRRGLR